jgi:hypothetical protein
VEGKHPRYDEIVKAVDDTSFNENELRLEWGQGNPNPNGKESQINLEWEDEKPQEPKRI